MRILHSVGAAVLVMEKEAEGAYSTWGHCYVSRIFLNARGRVRFPSLKCVTWDALVVHEPSSVCLATERSS